MRKTVIPTLCVSRSTCCFSESGFVKSSRESLIVSLGRSSQFGQSAPLPREEVSLTSLRLQNRLLGRETNENHSQISEELSCGKEASSAGELCQEQAGAESINPKMLRPWGTSGCVVPRPLGSRALDVDRKVIPLPWHTQRSPKDGKRGQGSS